MGIAAAIGAAATVGGALIGSSATKSAAKTQANAANEAAQTQLAMYQQTRSDLLPFQSTGASALSQLASIFGFGPGGTGAPSAAAATSQLSQFPGYQFGMDQGVQALDRSAASRGLLLSGAQQQAVQKFGQNYAQQQAWAPYVSGLQWAANLGENAAAGTGQAGATAAAGAAQSQLAAGQATAAGQVGVANILGSAGSQLANQFASSYGPSGLGPAGSGFSQPMTALTGQMTGSDPWGLGG